MQNHTENIFTADPQTTEKKPNHRGLSFPLYMLSYPELGQTKDFKELLEIILAYHICNNLAPYYGRKDINQLQKEIMDLKYPEATKQGKFQDITPGDLKDIETLSVLRCYLELYPVTRLKQHIERAKAAGEFLKRETDLRGISPYCSIGNGHFFSYLNDPTERNEELFRVYSAIKSVLGAPVKGPKSLIKRIGKPFILYRARGAKSPGDNEQLTARAINPAFTLSYKQLRNRVKQITNETDIKSYTVNRYSFYGTNRSKEEFKKYVTEIYFKGKESVTIIPEHPTNEERPDQVFTEPEELPF